MTHSNLFRSGKRYQRRPDLDPAERDRRQIKATEAALGKLDARIARHGAEGLTEWLRAEQLTAEGSTTRGLGLMRIRVRLGDEAWAEALQVMR